MTSQIRRLFISVEILIPFVFAVVKWIITEKERYALALCSGLSMYLKLFFNSRIGKSQFCFFEIKGKSAIFESKGKIKPPTVFPRTAANSKVNILASKIPDAPK